MSDFNLTNFIAKFGYKNIQTTGTKNISTQKAAAEPYMPAQASSTVSSSASQTAAASSSSAQMASLAGEDTAAYIKDLLKLPKNLNEFIYMVQRGLTQIQLSRLMAQQYGTQRNTMSPTQAQILAQLQGLSAEELQAALKTQLMTTNTAQSLKNLQILSGGMINLADLAAMIQANGKDAITKLILTMANTAKQGVTDLSQLKDTARLINASIALASQENSAQTLKTILLLYLPWLPLQEGTDFEIEIQQDPDNEDNDSILVITISTVNFGKVIATLILETSNSVHVNIECSDKFPKDELLNRMKNEEKHYSLQSVVSFQSIETTPAETTQTKASVTMSSMAEINPYMLLMSHTVIRNTIMIDNEASNGVITHTDTEGEK